MKCETCGAEFDEPAFILEHHTELDGCPSERWAACPDCHDTDIAEGNSCTLCGAYAGEDSVCEECLDTLRVSVRAVMDRLFSPAELRAVTEHIDYIMEE